MFYKILLYVNIEKLNYPQLIKWHLSLQLLFRAIILKNKTILYYK